MKSRIFAWLLALILLSACALALPGESGWVPLGGEPEKGKGPAAGKEMKEYRIITATDLHYISPVLTDQGEYFTNLVTYADGKAMPCIEEIAEAFTDRVISEAPDLVILSGDLTFNGAVKSHTDMAAKLSRIEKAGIPVLVIPGNHDIGRSSAAMFRGKNFTRVPSPDAELFRRIYRDFGPDEAASLDPVSGSYTWRAGEDLLILMLDTNSGAENVLPEASFAWLEQVLSEARERKERVIAVSHQNLYIHNKAYFRGVVIDNAPGAAALYEKYGVLLNLSGHMHMQHLEEDCGVPDMATSSLAVYPHHYGLITVSKEGLVYETRDLSVSAWARERGSEDPRLLDFENWSRTFFEKTMERQAAARAAGAEGFTKAEKKRMAEAMVRVTSAYFRGEPLDMDTVREAMDLWNRVPGAGYGAYVESIRRDLEKDHRHLEIRTGRD